MISYWIDLGFSFLEPSTVSWRFPIAFQILLGVVFGIWGLALALPLIAIAKVMIDHFKAEGPALQAETMAA